MSRQRLQALLDSLTERHWEVFPTEEYPDASPDLFRLEGEGELTWAIRRAGSSVIELHFWATTTMGQPTNDLNDIWSCCVASAPDVKLYFAKITSQEWVDDLRRFVFSLDEVLKRPPDMLP